jgi:hypothetical protein
MPKHTFPPACDTPAAISPPNGTMTPNELQGMAVETPGGVQAAPWTAAASRCHTLLQYSIRSGSQAQACCCRGRQQTHQLSVTTRTPGSTTMLFEASGQIWAPTDADTGTLLCYHTPGVTPVAGSRWPLSDSGDVSAAVLVPSPSSLEACCCCC